MRCKKAIIESKTTGITKSALLLMLVAMLSMALAACGQDGGETSGSGGSSAAPGSSSSATEEQGTSGEQVNPEVKEGSGMYTGQADPHTIEITIDGQAAAFQLGEGMDSEVAELEEQTPVDFTYMEKVIEGEAELKQLILLSIQPSASK